MNYKYWNLFLLIVFFMISSAVFSFGTYYKSSEAKARSEVQHENLSVLMSDKLKRLIEHKQNATLSIAISLAQNAEFKKALQKREDFHDSLFGFSSQLKEETDYKNVWIQLVDAKGQVVSRSWTQERGNDLNKLRLDVLKIINNPKVASSISVDGYDLSFKAMVPFFDDSEKFIGFLEVITHFNSIASEIKEEGFQTVVLVDKSYKKQLTHPFTNKFIDDYYVANTNIDDEVLLYVASQGVDNAVSYKKRYSIDEQKRYFQVNHTLFGLDNKPMAYVLMLKKMKDLDHVAIDGMSFIINVFMTFMIVVVGFALLFLRDKKYISTTDKVNKEKYSLIFFSIFISATLGYYLLLNAYKKIEKETFLKNYNANVEKDYQIINNKFETVAEIMFETTLNNEAVIELVAKAYGSQKDASREALLKLLQAKYDYFKRYNVRQLHFHLKNNESFLRFHRPQKHGDDLTGVRATVEWVNANHEKIKGFEEGRIYNGFRYVFPLTRTTKEKEKIHIGSVEVSFSTSAIADDFAQSHKTKAGFLIYKDVVERKVFNDEQSNYGKSEFESFYDEKAIKKQLQAGFKYYEASKISLKERTLANGKIFEGETFSVASEDGNALFTFLPLRNPVSKKIVATVVLQIENRILAKQNEFLLLLFLVGTTLILFITIFIFREYALKIKFLELSLKTQHILDTQKSIVIVTDGQSVFDVNKKFLDFFDYKTLDAFKAEHTCICDFFIEDENYYHLGKVPKETTWIEFLKDVPDKNRVVLMKDEDGKKYSFSMTFSHYKEFFFIVTFTDISGTIEEQLVLENKVIHDKLTGAYNREFFERQTDKIAREKEENGKFLGVILFDIDHFKAVNDDYGHNVGDYVLKELVKSVLNSIRGGDYLVRWGGEEFIVLISTKSLEEAESTANHLRSMIEHHKFEEVQNITCSFGVTLKLNEESIITTVERADRALYLSKENGRNRVTSL